MNYNNLSIKLKEIFTIHESVERVKYFWEDNIKQQTDDAYYLVINNNGFWIPKSVCNVRVNSNNKIGYWVSQWWLRYNKNKANKLLTSDATYSGSGVKITEDLGN